MFTCLQYPTVSSESVVIYAIDRSGSLQKNPVYNWMLFGKIGENPVVSPAYYTQVTTPSGKNRVLTEVTTLPIQPSTQAVTLAVNATSTYTTPGLTSATSSNTSVATVSVANSTATITGVAAGTSTVTLEDSIGKTISNITVTVS